MPPPTPPRPATPAAPAPAAPAVLAPGTKAKLTITRGLRPGKTFALKENGATYIGRAGPQPCDVNLTEQEKAPAILVANRHALVYFEKGTLSIADTGTKTGTFVNKVKIPPGKRYPLKAGDSVQCGMVVMEVKVFAKKKTGAQK